LTQARQVEFAAHVSGLIRQAGNVLQADLESRDLSNSGLEEQTTARFHHAFESNPRPHF
jgi:hypothetical protein